MPGLRAKYIMDWRWDVFITRQIFIECLLYAKQCSQSREIHSRGTHFCVKSALKIIKEDVETEDGKRCYFFQGG